MQTEIITSDNSIDPNAQTMPVDLVIVGESIVMDNSLATESVDLPAAESLVIEAPTTGIFPSSVPAADSLAEPLCVGDSLPLGTGKRYALAKPRLWRYGTRIGIDDRSTPASAANWESLTAKLSASFENAKSFITAFFKSSRQILITLGMIFLAIISVKVLFAAVSASDGIPLVAPLLKAIGLVYLGRFVWRYLIRERDRQELLETIDRTKAEVFGSQS